MGYLLGPRGGTGRGQLPHLPDGGWDKGGTALVHPARLAWGLAAACERLGVRILERTPVTGLAADAGWVSLRTSDGVCGPAGWPGHQRVPPPGAPAAAVHCPGVRLRAGHRTAQPRAAGRDRVAEPAGRRRPGNQFHYYRLTADDRILWGGYDAIYHFGRRIRAAYDQRPATFAGLAGKFFATFPQLEGLRFSHRWGGAIDTCSRFCAFFGTAHRGRVAYALGYTGLGVGRSRFGGRVMLDLLSGEQTELTELPLVRSKPMPFPPEPLRLPGRCRPPGGPWPGPTVTTAAGTCGCGP